MGLWSSQRSQPKSYSALLFAEALLVSGAGAYYLYGEGLDAGGAVAVAIVGMLAIRQVLVYVRPVFWLWTLILAVVASYFSYSWYVSEIDADNAMLVGGAAFAVVVLLHVVARFHSRMEDRFW
jgi:hypothetical protein